VPLASHVTDHQPAVWLIIFFVLNFGLVFLLAMNVSRVRLAKNITNGDGNDLDLKKAIRAHSNGLEHTVPFGILLLVAILTGTGPTMAAILTLAFTVGRVAHAQGMLSVNFQARRLGAALTYLLEVIVILVLIINAFTLPTLF